MLSPSQFGFGSKILAVFPAFSVSGTYYAWGQPAGPGQTTWHLRWIVASTGREVFGGADLSAEILQLVGTRPMKRSLPRRLHSSCRRPRRNAQSPTAACSSSNLNAAYSDNVDNVQYMCTAIGWKQNIGIGNPVVACAPKNYGQNYTDVSTPATFQCGVAGWFSITGGGGGSVPGGKENQDVQFNNSGVFGGNSSLTFNPSTAALTISHQWLSRRIIFRPHAVSGLYNND